MKHFRFYRSKKSETRFESHGGPIYQRRKMFLLLMVNLMIVSQGATQLPCLGVATECSGSTDPAVWATYKCIQGPANFSDLASPGQSLLLPQSQAATTAQRIIVKGLIKDDISTATGGYTFAAGSEIIFADESSGIEVNTGCKLTLDNTILKGCERMWKSVYVKIGATFIAQNGSSFTDGRDAIFVAHNSTISITNCYFQNNLTSISVGTTLPTGQKAPVQYTAGGGIWGNVIIGGDLKPPLDFKFSTRGINLLSLSNIQIGNAGQAQNDISNINGYIGDVDNDPALAGLYVNNSDVTVVNSHFSNNGFDLFANPLTERMRDASLSAENRSKITLIGLGMGSEIIEDSHVGGYFTNSDGDVSQAKLLNNEYDIVHEARSSMKSAGSLKVNNCKFEGFNRYGVWLKSGGIVPLAVFEVKNSIFDDTRTIPRSRVMLHVQPGAQTDGTNYKITDNKFFFRARAGSENFVGICISLFNLNKGYAAQNEFYDEGVIAPKRVFYAATMDGCIGFHWDNNDFFGSGSGIGIDLLDPSPSYDPEIGMIISNSPLCKYTCNNFNNLQVGMDFFENSDGSTLGYNNFNGHLDYAVHLAQEDLTGILPVIGRQDRRSNTWSTSGALFDYPGYNPNNAQHKNNVQRSLFSIQAINENSAFWANPREVDIIDDAIDHIWFQYKPFLPSEPYPIYPCELPTYPPYDPGPLDNMDMTIINGTFQPWRGYVADTWETSFYLYKRATENPGLITAGSAEASWYASQYNGNLGKFSRVFEGFVSLSGESSATTGSQLMTDLNAISTTTIYEQNLKTWLGIALDQYINNAEILSPQQVSDLTAIADQCRGEGGLGVVFARLALGQPSTRSGDCPEIEERNVQASELIFESHIFPNPVSGAFSIQVSHAIQDGHARLLDTDGRTVGNWRFSGTQFTVNPEPMASGVYLLEISNQGKILSRNKIVFIH